MAKELQVPDDSKRDKSEVWNRILRATLSLPGARIDRKAYLKKELSKHFSEEVVAKAIATRPANAGIPKSAIQSIAISSIKWHRAGVSTTSFTVGLPGGWWMAGTIPVDMTQFFWHVVIILQKLAYLHGWPSFENEEDELDDETLLLFTIFVGVMFGAGAASKALGELAEKLVEQLLVRLPKQALTKYGVYRLAREVAKWIGIKLTKDTFSRSIAKVVPIISGFLSGGITWVSFSVMSHRLRKHLEKLRLAEPDKPKSQRVQ